LIEWVKENFPAKIVDEVSGAEVEVGKNKELQEKLSQFKQWIKKEIAKSKSNKKIANRKRHRYCVVWEDGVQWGLRKILGESDE